MQVYSAADVPFGRYVALDWVQGFPTGSIVPADQTLEITTLTVNYFPEDTGGTLGRLDISGRNSAQVGTGTAIWRLQILYVEPHKTLVLTFPRPLRLQAGGHVEAGFIKEGPGMIFVEANGDLV